MFERIMGLNVIDNETYQKYREGMTPILNSYGADFVYDFIVSDTLMSKTEDNINRIFIIEFPSKVIMEEFFADPKYIEVKKKYLDHSIAGKTVISMNEKSTEQEP